VYAPSVPPEDKDETMGCERFLNVTRSSPPVSHSRTGKRNKGSKSAKKTKKTAKSRDGSSDESKGVGPVGRPQRRRFNQDGFKAPGAKKRK